MKKILTISMLWLFMIILIPHVNAEENTVTDDELSFELLDRESGLSNLAISSLVQDKYGFIWVGTQGGLNRYDGHEMLVYRNDPFDETGLIHNLIQTMYYDEKNHDLWIGTYHGVSKFDIEKETFENFSAEDGLSDPLIIAINQDSEGNIWLGTMNGISVIKTDGTIKQYGVGEVVVRDILIASNGVMYFGTYTGLYYYDLLLDELLFIETPLPLSSIMVLEEFEPGILTMGLWDLGLVYYNYETNTVDVLDLVYNKVYSLLKTSDGTLWAGTWGGGLYNVLEGRINHFSPSNNEVEGAVIYSLMEDHSGVFWVGTNGTGLFKYNPRKKSNVLYQHKPNDVTSLSKGKVTEIFEDHNRNLWIALYGHGLNVMKEGESVFTKYSHSETGITVLEDDLIVDIIEDEEDVLLLATGKGLVKVNTDTFEFMKWPIIPDDPLIYALEKTQNGDYWIGTHGQGLYIYNSTTEMLQHLTEESGHISNNLIYDILEDSKGRVWVATNDGLNLKENATEEFVVFMKEKGNEHNLPNDVVQLIYEDSSHNIWIGTDGGGIAVYLEDGSFKSYTERDGISSNSIVGILEDDDHRIIVSTQNGITSINPKTDEVMTFTPDDGIGGWEFNTGHLKTTSGQLLFGGLHGITEIPSHYHEDEPHEPHMYITNVELFQTSVKKEQAHYNDTHYTFDNDENSLSFEFVAIDYDNPDKTNYVYKLEGFDEDWFYSGNRTYVTYPHLPAGDYVFKVYAETSKRVVSKVATMHFKIKQHWSKTIYMYGLYVLLFTFLIMIIVKFREFSVVGVKNEELAGINQQLEIANNELEQLSTKDALTGVFNRRYFTSELNDRLLIAKRSNTFVTLMMIDLDSFKETNDQYGHIAGDYLLVDITHALVEVLPRKTDFISRYGGDEFAIVLYDTNLEGSLRIADRILERSKDVVIRKDYTDETIGTHVSIGLHCAIPDDSMTVEEMIKRADDALYQAKDNGGNQVIIN